MSPPNPQVSAKSSRNEEIPIFVEGQCLRVGKKFETQQLFYIEFLENAPSVLQDKFYSMGSFKLQG